MNVYHYKTEGGKDVILDYINSIDNKREKARILALIKELEKHGLEFLNCLETRQLVGKLWEIKYSKHRIMYVVIDGNNMYLIHACKKQKQKTEKYELEKAKARVRELEKLTGKKLLWV